MPTAIEKIISGLAELPGAIASQHGIPSPFAYRGPSAYPADEIAAGVGRVAKSAGGQMYAQAASPTYVHPPNTIQRVIDRGFGVSGGAVASPTVITAAPVARASGPVFPAEDRPNVVPTVAPRVVAQTPSPVRGEKIVPVPVEEKPLHERFASPREALRGMTDAEYKAFVDTHKIPGVGYTEKEGRLDRILPSSQVTAAQDLTPEQLHAVTSVAGVINQGKTAKASEARLGLEEKRAAREDRRLDLTEKRYDEMSKLDREKFAFEVEKLDKGSSLKEPANYVKALEMFSPDEVDEYGMKTGKKNYQAGGEALSAMGYPVPKGMKIPQTTAKIPQKGDVVKGYKFKGGNPADKNSWEKV